MMKQGKKQYIMVTCLLVCLGGYGCGKDARLSDKTIPHAQVGTVEDAGVVLDKQTEPGKVAYALLRAIHDDCSAGNDKDARQTAIDRQFNLCAPDAIFEHYKRFFPPNYPADRDELVYKTVITWAPCLGRFADSFDFDWDTAKTMFIQDSINKRGGLESTNILMNVTAPEDAPGASGESAVIRIGLVREDGYWRIRNTGFLSQVRNIAVPTRIEKTEMEGSE